MPYAVTLRLDAASAASIEAMWRALAEAGLDDGCLRPGYPPHVTLAVYPDDAPVPQLDATVMLLAKEWDIMPIELAGLGIFPGPDPVLWVAPVPTAGLLACQAALVAALHGLRCDGHYRPGHWMPHVTLGRVGAAARALEILAPLWPGAMTGRLERLDLVRFRPVTVLRSLALGP
ncbi:MAG: 2'-5' RNA ligase family protein [Acetobacteraceae bacterium]|nr:2'-5' RNA ligase family protein [Acetobacteraceae bacterium]